MRAPDSTVVFTVPWYPVREKPGIAGQDGLAHLAGSPG